MVRFLPVTLLLLSLSIVPVCNCGYLNPKNEEFSFSRIPYTGNEIRVDGYYTEPFASDSSGVSATRSSILLFNRNGVALQGGSPLNSGIAQREEEFSTGQYYATYKDNKTVWGIFKINNQNITYEWWYNRNGSFRVERYFGEILNDTTIHFSASEMVDGSEHSAENMTYHFKQFSPKPDSVVSFIP